MSLVAVQPAPRHPLAVHVLSLLRGKYADAHVARRLGLESDDQSRTREDELVRPRRDDQPAGDGVRRLSVLCGRRRGTLVSYVQRVTAEPYLMQHSLFGTFRQQADHRVLPLMLKN